MYKFVIYFIGIQLALFSLEQSNNVHTNIIIPFTEMIAHISVWVVKLFDDNVISHGVILQQVESGFKVKQGNNAHYIQQFYSKKTADYTPELKLPGRRESQNSGYQHQHRFNAITA
jgi:hypothetical protein